MTTDHASDSSEGLKVSITDLAPARKGLSIEVSAAQVSAEYDAACRSYTRRLKVPGFRAGKVPADVVRRRFGREIEQETVEHVIQHALGQAVAQAGLQPLRAPVLKEYTWREGEPLSFTAELEIRPRVSVKGHREIKVRMRAPEVTEKMTAEALESLRERAARFVPVEGRGVHVNDHVVIDVEGRVVNDQTGGAAGEPFAHNNILMEVGSGGPHPEMSDELKEMKPGETRSFTIAYPKTHESSDFAGRRVSYTVTLREIKEKVLAELNDDLAADLGQFTSLADLRQHVADDLLARETRRARDEARNSVVDALLERNPDVPAPDVMVEEELDLRLETMARAMSLQGMDPRSAQLDWDGIRQRQRENAVKRVRAMILLDAIAEEEKISLEPEVLKRALEEQAARRKQTADAFKARLARDGRLEGLERELLRDKVLDFLLVTANI